MQFRVRPDVARALRATRRVQKRTPVATAQILNTQRRQSRTRITRQVSTAAGIKPQRRVRRRVLIRLRNGAAKPRKLEAVGLTLFEAFPQRYFRRGLPPGARSVLEPEGTPDRKGRRTVGGAFTATMPGSKFTGQFRRLSRGKRRQRPDGQSTYLPIAPVRVVNLEPLGYAIRLKVLEELSGEFPGVWEKRMQREIDRAFRR